MKSTYAILLAVVAALVLAPTFSGCGGDSPPPAQDAGDIQTLQEKQMKIIQRERGDPVPRKGRKG